MRGIWLACLENNFVNITKKIQNNGVADQELLKVKMDVATEKKKNTTKCAEMRGLYKEVKGLSGFSE